MLSNTTKTNFQSGREDRDFQTFRLMPDVKFSLSPAEMFVFREKRDFSRSLMLRTYVTRKSTKQRIIENRVRSEGNCCLTLWARMISGPTFIAAGAFDPEFITNDVMRTLDSGAFSGADITCGARRNRKIASNRVREKIDLRLAAALGEVRVVHNSKNEVRQGNKFGGVPTDLSTLERPYYVLAGLSLQEAGAKLIPNLIENPAIVVRSSAHP